MKINKYALLLPCILLLAGSTFAQQAAEIGNFVWEDMDADGIQDAGEPGIASVTVTLTGTDMLGNAVNQSTTSSAAGIFLFGNLLPGTYQLTFTSPGAGYKPTARDQGAGDSNDSDVDIANLTTVNTVLSAGESDRTWDAGFFRPASIQSFVWNDLDKNGRQNAGEPGFPNLSLTLTGNSGSGQPTVKTIETNASGIGLLDDLTPGTYQVAFSYPVGCFTATLQNQGPNDTIDSDMGTLNLRVTNVKLQSGQNNELLDAGFYEGIQLGLSGSVCGPGQIEAFISSSIHAPISYIWDDGAGGTGNGNATTQAFTISGLAGGTYTVSTTDALGCSATATATVIEAPIPVLSFSVTNIFCPNDNNGAIDLTVTGGTVFTYIWSDGQTTEDIQNAQPGTYTVTVTSETGCTTTGSATINSANPAIIPTFLVSNVSCFGGSNGSIDLTVSGGQPPYTYDWSHDGPEAPDNDPQDLINVAAGTHTVTITDANGCSTTASRTITQPTALNLSTTQVNVLCFGAASGSINLTVTGGTGGYNYDWNHLGGNNNPQDPQGLIAGTYTVTVTDANGCTKTISATITQPAEINLTTNVTNVLCFGAANGSIDLTVSGGASPYIYQWMTAHTTQDISNIPAGTYTVTVFDANGCTATKAATITQPPALSITTNITPVPCGGSGNEGSVDITLTGGQPPYLYLWSNNAVTQDITGLGIGVYTVTVTDANNCTRTAVAEVKFGFNISLSSFSVVDASCSSSAADGVITLLNIPPNAALPLSFNWTGPNNFSSQQQDISGLPSGIYQLVIIDATDCEFSATLTVGKKPSDILSNRIVVNPNCNSANSGSISLNPTGGTAPYTYDWSHIPGANNPQNLQGLPTGAYGLTVTDALGCTIAASYSLAQTAGFTISATLVNTGCTGANGAIDITVTGGAPPFNFLWSTGETTEDISGLSPGIYIVTVTDNNLCVRTDSRTIANNSSLLLNTSVTHANCNNSGSINLGVNGGTLPHTYNWSNGATTEDLSNVAPSSYCVTVTDALGCSNTACTTVLQISPQLSLLQIIPPTCSGQNNGSIVISVGMGMPPYTFAWNNGMTIQNPTNLPAGQYCVTVADVQACTATACYTVTDPAPLAFEISSLSNDCSSEILSGPALPNAGYSWFGPDNFTANTPSITATISGEYTLIVTDANNCSASDTHIVNVASNNECGRIRGRVVLDELEDCIVDPAEPGLSGWLVRAEGADTLYGVTNANGEYYIGAPLGAYTVHVIPPNALWLVCPGNSIVATITAPNDTVFGGDFPVQKLFDCPELSVSIGVNQLRRCFSNNVYQINYCNYGTVEADDAFILLTFPPLISYISSSIPAVNWGNNTWRFNLGNIEIGDCGAFTVKVQVSCNAQLGQTLCTEAHIYPDTTCGASPLWSGASLDVRSECVTDTLHFDVKNVGNGSTTGISDYIVVEDAVMFMQAPLPLLNPGESTRISFPANGSTWRIEVEQEANHPYPAPVGLSVEGCSTSAAFSTGFVNQFSYNDAPPSIDIDCSTVIGSFDPNDKQGFPLGYGSEHYIRPGTDIEYMIRFQNTGTDTAFTVRIIDTLSAWLDPASIRFGVSSHPYRYDLCGEGVAHFIFENIFLPDSNINEAASHGFVKFNIKPRSDAPLESAIENAADIYFDFNDPVRTNTTLHRLGINFMNVGLWQPHVPEVSVRVMPNPFSETAVLEVQGLPHAAPLRLQIFDLLGNMVSEQESATSIFHLKRGDWQAGVYLFNISQNGKSAGSGKLVVE